jgi:hypothetical protein
VFVVNAIAAFVQITSRHYLHCRAIVNTISTSIGTHHCFLPSPLVSTISHRRQYCHCRSANARTITAINANITRLVDTNLAAFGHNISARIVTFVCTIAAIINRTVASVQILIASGLAAQYRRPMSAAHSATQALCIDATAPRYDGIFAIHARSVGSVEQSLCLLPTLFGPITRLHCLVSEHERETQTRDAHKTHTHTNACGRVSDVFATKLLGYMLKSINKAVFCSSEHTM